MNEKYRNYRNGKGRRRHFNKKGNHVYMKECPTAGSLGSKSNVSIHS
jgi:hypothetical protein